MKGLIASSFDTQELRIVHWRALMMKHTVLKHYLNKVDTDDEKMTHTKWLNAMSKKAMSKQQPSRKDQENSPDSLDSRKGSSVKPFIPLIHVCE